MKRDLQAQDRRAATHWQCGHCKKLQKNKITPSQINVQKLLSRNARASQIPAASASDADPRDMDVNSTNINADTNPSWAPNLEKTSLTLPHCYRLAPRKALASPHRSFSHPQPFASADSRGPRQRHRTDSLSATASGAPAASAQCRRRSVTSTLSDWSPRQFGGSAHSLTKTDSEGPQSQVNSKDGFPPSSAAWGQGLGRRFRALRKHLLSSDLSDRRCIAAVVLVLA
ncbi:hypothetical protein B0H11DRAFT_1149601 [Mycena galericulata]|nr:hypothetical protein B0H11DRAFT_1149601 [Mycena galericulata]